MKLVTFLLSLILCSCQTPRYGTSYEHALKKSHKYNKKVEKIHKKGKTQKDCPDFKNYKYEKQRVN